MEMVDQEFGPSHTSGARCPSIHYTAVELQRKRLHFYHPSTEKLFVLVTRTDPTRASPSVRRLLEQLINALNYCRPFLHSLFDFVGLSVPKIQ